MTVNVRSIRLLTATFCVAPLISLGGNTRSSTCSSRPSEPSKLGRSSFLDCLSCTLCTHLYSGAEWYFCVHRAHIRCVYYLAVTVLPTVITYFFTVLLASRLNMTDGYVASVAKRTEHLVGTTGELQGMIAARLSPAPADVISDGSGVAGSSMHNHLR